MHQGASAGTINPTPSCIGEIFSHLVISIEMNTGDSSFCTVNQVVFATGNFNSG